MKKIFNWTFGAFFRTIGRVFAFLILGSIFGYFVSKIGFNFDFLTMSVSASTFNTAIWENYSSGGNLLPSTSNGLQYRFIPAGTQQYFINLSSDITQTTNIEEVRFDFLLTGTFYTSDSNFEEKDIVCDYYPMTGDYYASRNCRSITANSIGSPVEINFKMFVSLVEKNGQNQSQCRIEGSQIVCPLQKNITYDTINITSYRSSGSTTEQINIVFNHVVGLYYDINNSIQNSINNQTQQQHQDSQNTQNAINDVNDTINDDDTSEATSSASDLFNNYEDDDFGLSGIITAPLDLIESMISPTCNPIKLTGASGIFEDVDIELPCLTPLYEDFFGDVLDIYQMITFGIISYKIVVDIFGWVRSFKNPDEDRLEVIDL